MKNCCRCCLSECEQVHARPQTCSYVRLCARLLHEPHTHTQNRMRNDLDRDHLLTMCAKDNRTVALVYVLAQQPATTSKQSMFAAVSILVFGLAR